MGRSPLSESKLDRQQDPHGDGIIPSTGGVKSPSAHCVRSGQVEIGVTGGFLDDDLANATVDQDVDLE
jgi:hypothetical protein